jgi:hypothetical protein
MSRLWGMLDYFSGFILFLDMAPHLIPEYIYGAFAA